MASPDDGAASCRLPTSVVPSKYWLDYEVVDLMHLRFEASERIALAIREPTREITCHAVNLHVFNVSLELEIEENGETSTRTIPCEALALSLPDETVTFQFAEVLPVTARAILRLQFRGLLNDKVQGFFAVEYTHENETRRMAGTDFEACYARRAFVCWDEPACKASFEISVVTDVDMTALSNMHVVRALVRKKENAGIREHSRREASTEKLWQFAETPVMSTYLVALVVGEFDVVSQLSKENVMVSIYGPPEQGERLQFALDVATKALSFYSNKFDIPYPLKKLDLVWIPEFPGAMENWGLVTCTDRGLVIDEKLTSHRDQVIAAEIICHEISHQWFGNLVTMKWWDGLWLNEGYAQYMENSAVDAIFPEWHVWDLFVQEVALGEAFDLDAMVSSHPIEAVVNKPTEVDEIFDAISYQKGASFVRMLAEFLGQDVFYRGVHNYLVTHAYKNTVPEDLWAALEQESGQSIADMANSWIRQTGFPVVTVEKCVDGKGFQLTQQRFLQDPDANNADETAWDLPLSVITSSNSNEIKRIGIWQASSKDQKNRKGGPFVAPEVINAQLSSSAASSAWVKLNPHNAGFYLVNYSADMWKQLETPIRNGDLGITDRVSLLNNVFRLAQAGMLSITKALEFTQAFENEPSFICCKEIATNLQHLNLLVSEQSFYPKFQAFVRAFFTPFLQRLTWDPTEEDKLDSATSQFRSTVIQLLGEAGDSSVIEETEKRFAAYMAGDKDIISADLKGILYRFHAMNSSDSSEHVIEQCKLLYKSSVITAEKMYALRGIGALADTRAKLQVLEWGVASLKPNELYALMVYAALGNPKSAAFVWEYIKTNFKLMTSKLSMMDLGSTLNAVLSQLQSEDNAKDVEAFIAANKVVGVERRLREGIEKIRLNAKEIDQYRDALSQWFEKRP